MDPYERLSRTTDAQAWADEFLKAVEALPPGPTVDEGFMIGWFANAIETAKSITPRMTEKQFRSLLNLHMTSDPTPLPEPQDNEVENFLNEEARRRGFEDWVDAYHKLPDFLGMG